MDGAVVRPEAQERASRVRLFLVDVDGVLSDGGIVYDADGREIKRFHVRDGHGIVMMQRSGIEVGIITGRVSPVTAVRARELGIETVVQGAIDKLAALSELLERKGVAPEETAYVGDDIVDLPVMRRVGFAAAVADAEGYVRDAADYVASRGGGHGAVREVIEFVLRATGKWEQACARYYVGETR